MRVLVACEESQEVCKAFRALGHDAYSCDIEPCSGGLVYRGVIPWIKTAARPQKGRFTQNAEYCVWASKTIQMRVETTKDILFVIRKQHLDGYTRLKNPIELLVHLRLLLLMAELLWICLWKWIHRRCLCQHGAEVYWHRIRPRIF